MMTSNGFAASAAYYSNLRDIINVFNLRDIIIVFHATKLSSITPKWKANLKSLFRSWIKDEHFSVNLCKYLPPPCVLFYSFYTMMLSSQLAVILLGGVASHLVLIITFFFWRETSSQPLSSIFLCSQLPSGTWRTPVLSVPWCCLPTSSSVCLIFFPLSMYLVRWF